MWDALISAGTKLIGGWMDQNTAEKNREAQLEMARQNIAYQREFAQQGLRWKVEDARAAGIHPLYALGASGTSFSPVSIGNLPEGNMRETLGGMGQDISRAISATRTADERNDAFMNTAKALDLEGKKLDNDIKRAQLASSVQRIKQQANPPFPGSVPGLVPSEDFAGQKRLAAGREWLTDPRQSGAQEWEDRYGETISDWVMGPMTAWKDFIYNYPRIDAVIEGMKRPASFNERFGSWRQNSSKSRGKKGR